MWVALTSGFRNIPGALLHVLAINREAKPFPEVFGTKLVTLQRPAIHRHEPVINGVRQHLVGTRERGCYFGWYDPQPDLEAMNDSETIALSQDYRQNRVSMDLDYSLSPDSSLSFGLGHSLRRYQGNLPVATNLSDEDSFNGNLGYTHTMSPRTSWLVGYSVSQYNFQDFENARTHLVGIGFSHQLRPSVSLRMGTGPSYTEATDVQSSFLSWKNASFTLSKSLENNLLSFSYWLRSGTSTGVGSVSDAQTFRFDFNRPLGRRTSVSANVTLYETEGRLDNPVDNRGWSTSLAFDFLLHDRWALGVGGSYQDQEENRQDTDAIDVVRRRVFVSLRFTLPELVRF